MTEKRGDETRHLLSYSSVCATRHLMIVLHAIFCLQVVFRNLSSRNCPQYFGTGPIDQGGTRHGGSALGSRELLCLFGRISGTLACYSSLSELCLPGESASCRMQGESAAGGVTSFYRLASRGGFSGGLGTSRRRRVIQRHDKSSRCRLQVQGARHVTSLPSDRGSTHHVVAAYQGTMPSLRLSVGKFLPSPIQPVVSIPSGRFFFPHRFTVFVARTIDTSPPGAFGRNGFHGESA